MLNSAICPRALLLHTFPVPLWQAFTDTPVGFTPLYHTLNNPLFLPFPISKWQCVWQIFLSTSPSSIDAQNGCLPATTFPTSLPLFSSSEFLGLFASIITLPTTLSSAPSPRFRNGTFPMFGCFSLAPPLLCQAGCLSMCFHSSVHQNRLYFPHREGFHSWWHHHPDWWCGSPVLPHLPTHTQLWIPGDVNPLSAAASFIQARTEKGKQTVSGLEQSQPLGFPPGSHKILLLMSSRNRTFSSFSSHLIIIPRSIPVSGYGILMPLLFDFSQTDRQKLNTLYSELSYFPNATSSTVFCLFLWILHSFSKSFKTSIDLGVGLSFFFFLEKLSM